MKSKDDDHPVRMFIGFLLFTFEILGFCMTVTYIDLIEITDKAM